MRMVTHRCCTLPVTPAMGKRVSTGSAGRASKKTKDASSSASTAASTPGNEDAVHGEAVHSFLKSHEWAVKVLERFDAEMETHGDPIAFLDSLMPTTRLKDDYAAFLDKNFPPDDNVHYAADWAPGTKHLRPYHMCWHAQSGNKGFIYLDRLKNLVLLVMAKGFLTNPSLPGVESLVIAKPQLCFFKADEFDFPALDKVGIGAAHTVKGWTRGVAFHVLMQLLQLTDSFNMFTESCTMDKLMSFRTIFANCVNVDTTNQIDMNRGTCRVKNKGSCSLVTRCMHVCCVRLISAC